MYYCNKPDSEVICLLVTYSRICAKKKKIPAHETMILSMCANFSINTKMDRNKQKCKKSEIFGVIDK